MTIALKRLKSFSFDPVSLVLFFVKVFIEDVSLTTSKYNASNGYGGPEERKN